MKNLLFGTDGAAGAQAHQSSNTESNQSDIVLAQLSQVYEVLKYAISAKIKILSFELIKHMYKLLHL